MANELEVRVEIAARPATVRRFLSTTEGLRRWLGDGAGIDPVEGGSVRVAYPTGEVATGRVVSAGEDRLEFTWGYEDRRHGMGPGSTRVVITLEPVDGGTRVVLRHLELPDEEARTGHRRGWQHYLWGLSTAATAAELGPRVPDAVQAYLAAWNEDGAEQRARLLSACFAEAGTFRDANAAVEGRAALDEYIAGARQYMPHARILLDGEPEHVHDRVHYPWRVEAGGSVVMAGWNYGRLDGEGRFVDVVGFRRRG